MSAWLRSNTLVWLLLLALTVAGFAAAEAGLVGGGMAVAVLLATLIKGELVIHRFMGLADVAWPWRALLSGYLLLVLGLIGVAYFIALQ